jgi:hypothetical protein
VEAEKSYIIFNSSLSFYEQLITGVRADFVKKHIPAEVEGSKKRQKIGKSLIVNQPVQLES